MDRNPAGDRMTDRRIVLSIACRRPGIRIAARCLPEMWIASLNSLLQFMAAIVAIVNRRAGSLAIFIMTCAVLGFTIVALLWSNRRPR